MKPTIRDCLAAEPSPEPSPEELVATAELGALMRRALAHLKPRERRIVELYSDGASYREISRELAVSVERVRQVYVRTLRVLRSQVLRHLAPDLHAEIHAAIQADWDSHWRARVRVDRARGTATLDELAQLTAWEAGGARALAAVRAQQRALRPVPVTEPWQRNVEAAQDERFERLDLDERRAVYVRRGDAVRLAARFVCRCGASLIDVSPYPEPDSPVLCCRCGELMIVRFAAPKHGSETRCNLAFANWDQFEETFETRSLQRTSRRISDAWKHRVASMAKADAQ